MIRDFNKISSGNVGTSASTTRRLAANRRRSARAPVWLIGLLFAGLALVAGQTLAVGKYSVEVAVNGQDETEQQDAYRTGLRLLLSRLSQDSRITNRENVRAALANAISYVDQFDFRAPQRGTDASGDITSNFPVTRKVRQTGEVTHILQIDYSESSLQSLLSEEVESEDDEQPAPVIREDRRALVWMLVEDNGPAILVGGSMGGNVAARLRELGGGVGWLLNFPELDTVDMSLLGPDDLVQGNQEVILAASERYALPHVLSAVIKRDARGLWQARYRRFTDIDLEQSDDAEEATTLSSTFEQQGVSLDELLQIGTAWWVGAVDENGNLNTENGELVSGTNISQPSASSNGSVALGSSGLSDSSALVWLGSVSTPAAYARSIDFLRSVELVENVQPAQVRADGILFSVFPRAAISTIQSAATRRSWLQPGSAPKVLTPAAQAAAVPEGLPPADATSEDATPVEANSEDAIQQPLQEQSPAVTASPAETATTSQTLRADIYLDYQR